MQVKLLENLIEELAGEETGRIANILFNKRDVNEFLIARKMELTINQVRNILYKLSNHGLVSFIRKKDNKKGWYIYFWTLDTEKCLVLIEKSLTSKINKHDSMLDSRMSDRYYVCKPCGIEVKEEQALENGFSCEECAEVYELSDNSPYIRDIKAKITRTKKELELIMSELEEKKRKRASKKLEKEAAEKKEMLKIARALARKKLAKEKGKTEIKKKPLKKVAKKAVKKVKKAVKKVVKKAVKKVVKKAVKKVVKKIVKKIAKKAVKKVKKK